MSFEAQAREFKKYIGTALFNVVTLNPTADELKIIKGTDKEQTERDYFKTTPSGVKGISLTFWMKNPKTGLKPLFMDLYNEPAQSKDGTWKTYIDIKGNTQMAKDMADLRPDFFDVSNCRVAYRGEAELSELMRAFMDRHPKDIKSCRLDDVPKIIGGDLTELKSFLKQYGKQVVCLVYGDEKGYTNLWNKGFGTSFSLESEKVWGKKLGELGSYRYPKGAVSIKFVEWNPDIKMDDDAKPLSADPFAKPKDAPKTDDLPF